MVCYGRDKRSHTLKRNVTVNGQYRTDLCIKTIAILFDYRKNLTKSYLPRIKILHHLNLYLARHLQLLLAQCRVCIHFSFIEAN